MRALHLITTIERGGAENQLLILVRQQVQMGNEIELAYLKGSPELKSEFEMAGALIHNGLANRNPLIQLLQLWKIMKRRRIILHAHLPRAEIMAAICPARFKLIVSRHNTEPFFPGAITLVSIFLSRVVSIRATRVIAISNAVRDWLIKSRELTDNRKIDVVYYGYEKMDSLISPRVFVGSSRIQLGTISRLTDQKDIPTMLKAVQLCKTANPNLELKIVGAGPLEDALKVRTKDLGLQDSVHFLGRTAEIQTFLRELDVFVLTSKYEGFGLVLLEAMDAGVPIVASRNSAITEVLGEDFPGLCSTGDERDFSEKILRSLDADYRENVLEIQKKRLFEFSVEKMERRISSIYLR